MRLFFNQNPQLFFVALLVIIAFMLVYILLQHSKINGLMVLLNIQSATVDQSDSRFLTDDDLAPASVISEHHKAAPVKEMSIEVKDLAGKYGGYNWADKSDIDTQLEKDGELFGPGIMRRTPNPATFNSEVERCSGGGQT